MSHGLPKVTSSADPAVSPKFVTVLGSESRTQRISQPTFIPLKNCEKLFLTTFGQLV
jgi:hypothetical protein